MRAIQIGQQGDASVLQVKEDVPVPIPGKGEALVRLKAAGLNFIDIYMRKGQYPTAMPYIPGLEGAGIVEAIHGDVRDVKIGDRVAYTGAVGSYAEYNIVKADQLIPLPDDITFEQGAAFPLQGMTAHYLVHDYYPITSRDTVLVHAAAGGVGLLLVQWIKHLGATVIGTVSTDEKAKLARDAGADHVILYDRQDFVEETKKFTQGRGADYIIDGVGKTTFTHDLDAVRRRGVICIFGSASGPAEPIAPNVLQKKSIVLAGGSLFNSLDTRQELLGRAGAVLKGIREGWLQLNINHVFPLDEAAKAQMMLEGRQTTGKVVLTIE